MTEEERQDRERRAKELWSSKDVQDEMRWRKRSTVYKEHYWSQRNLMDLKAAALKADPDADLEAIKLPPHDFPLAVKQEGRRFYWLPAAVIAWKRLRPGKSGTVGRGTRTHKPREREQ